MALISFQLVDINFVHFLAGKIKFTASSKCGFPVSLMKLFRKAVPEMAPLDRHIIIYKTPIKKT